MEFQFTAMECIIIGIKMLTKDSNSIGEDGVKKLLSREWPALKKIFLSN